MVGTHFEQNFLFGIIGRARTYLSDGLTRAQLVVSARNVLLYLYVFDLFCFRMS